MYAMRLCVIGRTAEKSCYKPKHRSVQVLLYTAEASTTVSMICDLTITVSRFEI